MFVLFMLMVVCLLFGLRMLLLLRRILLGRIIISLFRLLRLSRGSLFGRLMSLLRSGVRLLVSRLVFSFISVLKSGRRLRMLFLFVSGRSRVLVLGSRLLVRVGLRGMLMKLPRMSRFFLVRWVGRCCWKWRRFPRMFRRLGRSRCRVLLFLFGSRLR